MGEATAYKTFIRGKMGPEKTRPRGKPPSLSPALHDALDEIQLVRIGYKPKTPIEDMSYFSVRVRQIAAGIDNLINKKVL